MVFEEIIKNATLESENNTRRGDKEEEVRAIQDYIRSSDRIIVLTTNSEKIEALNKVLSKYGIKEAKPVELNTNFADYTRIPALFKGLAAIDQYDADLIITRGRLGVPGSGSFLVFLDSKGRILTGGMSSSHVIHKKSVEEAVNDEVEEALKKVGF